MLVAMLYGSTGGSDLAVLFVLMVISIPIAVALIRNRRYAESNRYSHMEGWVPGNPGVGEFHGLIDAPPSPYRTGGPRVVADERTAFGKRAWIVAGATPPAAPPELIEDPAGEPRLPSMTIPIDLPATECSVDPNGETPEERPQAPAIPEVRVLGRVEVTAWHKEPDRRVVPELACFLALHADRQVPGEEIRAALWPGDLETTEASTKSLHNAVSLLRKSLGAQFVPEASKGSGYRLAPEVRSDWDRFQELVRQAVSSGEEVELLSQALRLVRGAPFEGVAPGSFTWAWTELYVARMEVAVSRAAARLAAACLDASEYDTARWAVLKGLSAAPYDRQLWRSFLTVAAGCGPGELDRAVKHATSVLGEDVHEYDELIEGFRQRR